MKYKVERASNYDLYGETKPCEEAIGESKYAGTTILDTEWFIEIETIEQLLAFIKKYGKIVLSQGEFYPEIIIYDGYME